MRLLEIRGITKTFGGLVAVNEVDLHVDQGEIVGLIGPNGSGKTTLINLLTGIYRCNAGVATFMEEDITNMPPHKITFKGIARTFQGNKVFSRLSVLENVLTGRHCRTRGNLFGAMFQFGSKYRELREAEGKALELLDFVGLADKQNSLVSSLPYGHQSLLGIAIALATEPSLLLLDEPMAGMNPQEINQIMAFIQKVRDMGIAIILVEHNMKAIMGICERIIVLNYGSKIAEGTPKDIVQDQKVIRAYLGRKGGAQAS